MYLTKRKSAELAPFSPIVNHESCSREDNLVSYYQLTLFQFRQTFPYTPSVSLFIVHFFYLPIIIPFFVFSDVTLNTTWLDRKWDGKLSLITKKERKNCKSSHEIIFNGQMEHILISLCSMNAKNCYQWNNLAENLLNVLFRFCIRWLFDRVSTRSIATVRIKTKNNALSNQKISKKSIFQSLEQNFWNWILLHAFFSWNYQFNETIILIIFVFREETKLCKKRFQKILIYRTL